MDALLNLDPVAIALSAIVIALLTLTIALLIARRQGKILDRYRQLLNGEAKGNLEDLLLNQTDQLQSAVERIAQLNKSIEKLSTGVQAHVQRTAIVRFNAFPDTGSDLSFAIALLDAHNNGLVLSSLYGRQESRVYAKPIQAGASTYILTDEEKEALAKAIRGR